MAGETEGKAMNSDWSQTIKPVAGKLYAELCKAHGERIGALIEALEIARRRAEIDQTERDWRERWGFACVGENYQAKNYLAGGNTIAEAVALFQSFREEFGPQRAVHIITGLEREHTRGRWAIDMETWRTVGKLTVEAAASELGLAVEDVLAIEAGTLNAGPDAMRLIRPALRRVRQERVEKQGAFSDGGDL
jgi:hypothetical protein